MEGAALLEKCCGSMLQGTVVLWVGHGTCSSTLERFRCQQTGSVRKAALRMQQANLPGLAEGMAQLAFNEQQSCGREVGSDSFQIFYLALRFTRTKLTLNHSEPSPLAVK